MEKLLIHCLPIPIRWTDLDAYGHVNNAKFFDYMTEARCQLLRELMEQPDLCQFVVVNASCDFKLPLMYLDEVMLNQYLDNLGNTSFTLSYEFTKIISDQEHLAASGSITMVCIDKQNKPTQVPKIVLDHLGI